MPGLSRADLHVHSIYSQQPSEWFLRKIGCYESYTPPSQIYRLAKQRGMDFVTITDHDVIDGALEIAHLEGAFVSEEVATRFPEDDCVIHVVTLNISENQHREIQKYKDNIFELVGYLHELRIIFRCQKCNPFNY
ncbi:PHP domain-containing protein, partial [candidate division NPL-UPA2 bacterium]|nr:PHP domain-containing protein [candidate division NPL-UPA2 bacterium]